MIHSIAHLDSRGSPLAHWTHRNRDQHSALLTKGFTNSSKVSCGFTNFTKCAVIETANVANNTFLLEYRCCERAFCESSTGFGQGSFIVLPKAVSPCCTARLQRLFSSLCGNLWSQTGKRRRECGAAMARSTLCTLAVTWECRGNPLTWWCAQVCQCLFRTHTSVQDL